MNISLSLWTRSKINPFHLCHLWEKMKNEMSHRFDRFNRFFLHMSQKSSNFAANYKKKKYSAFRKNHFYFRRFLIKSPYFFKHKISPIHIEADGFTLTADSGSLKYDIEINVSKLPYKGGVAMRSNMENVTGTGNGVRLLPNGEHFSEAHPALISLSYDPDRLPIGYKPIDI